MKFKRIAFILLLVMGLGVLLTGCDGTPVFSVSGLVTDSSNSSIVQGAKVSIGGKSATTDAKGQYKINDIQATSSEMAVVVEKTGYGTYYTSIKLNELSDNYILNLGIARSNF